MESNWNQLSELKLINWNFSAIGEGTQSTNTLTLVWNLFIYLLVRGYQANTPIQKYSAEDL